MAMERVGLGGVLSFESGPAVQAMNSATSATNTLVNAQTKLVPSAQRAGGAIDSMSSRVSRASAAIQAMAGKAVNALNTMGSGLRNLGVALAPLALGFGFGLKQAADFEQQMSAVGAISRASGKDMDALTLKAKQMGVLTTFTATQAGQAMEELARAGFNTKEVLGGIDGVLAAAAADSIPLATAADIVARVIRGMGLEATQAGRVADVLALTSARSATDVISLGESFKYAASQAKVMEIPLETVSGVLGVLADAGLRGSIGGTSFTNMLAKLADPSEKSAKWLKVNRIEMTKLADGGLDIVAVIKQIHEVLNKETDVVKKAAMATELFGLRGQKAFSAMSLAIKSGKMDTLIKDLLGASGTAAEMAKKRLDNFKGSITLLKSSIESFFIETTGMFLGPLKNAATGFTDELNKMLLVFQKMNAGITDTEALNKEFGTTAVALAKGIKEGFNTVIQAVKLVREVVIGFIERVSGQASPQLIQSIAKWITILLLVGAAMSPILIVLGTILTFVAMVIIPMFKVLLITILALAAIGSGAILLIGSAWMIVRRHGESFGATMGRVMDIIRTAILYVINTAITPFWRVFVTHVMPVIETLKRRIIIFTENARKDFAQLFGSIIQAAQYLRPLFVVVFRFLGNVIGTFVKNSILMFRALMFVLGPVFTLIKEIGIFLLENVVNNIQLAMKLMVKVADLAGMGGKVSKEMREFAMGKPFEVKRLLAVQQIQGAESPTPEKPKEEGDFWNLFGKEDPFAAIAKNLTAGMAGQKGIAAVPPKTELNVDLTDKRKLDISNCLNVDGRNLAVAQARHVQEVNERAGFRATPWQRRTIMEQGAVPTLTLGGR